MRLKSFTIIELLLIIFAIFIIAAIIVPLNLTDTSQAQRVAKWHRVYDELDYSFQLLRQQEGSIFGDEPEKLTQGEYFERISPFLNIAEDSQQVNFEKYKYRYRNKTYVKKTSKYYYNDFFMMKNNVIASLKKNMNKGENAEEPYAYMFIDVNGFQKPNRIGLDIFFINIFNDRISAYGDGYPISKLSAGCSKIGKGLFCSKYYLIGSNL